MVAYFLSPNRCHWYIIKAKNYNLNVTKILDSDFKNALPGIFNFTVGILVQSYLRDMRNVNILGAIIPGDALDF